MHMQVMLDDVCAAYDALRVGKTPRLPMVRLQYPDFATWQARQLVSSSLLHQVSAEARCCLLRNAHAAIMCPSA